MIRVILHFYVKLVLFSFSTCNVFMLDDAYRIPQELYYDVVDGTIVLMNNSLLEMSLYGTKLIVDDVYEISLNGLSPIAENANVYIYKKKPKQRKFINYLVDKHNQVTENSNLSLQINDRLFPLKHIAK